MKGSFLTNRLSVTGCTSMFYRIGLKFLVRLHDQQKDPIGERVYEFLLFLFLIILYTINA